MNKKKNSDVLSNFRMPHLSKYDYLAILLVFIGFFIRIYNVNNWGLHWNIGRILHAAEMVQNKSLYSQSIGFVPTYFIALSFLILGINDFAARMPSIIAGSLIILVVYFLGKKLYKNPKVGILSAFIATFSYIFVSVSRSNNFENFMIIFLCFSFYYAYKVGSKKKYFIFSAFFLILAILSRYNAAILLFSLGFYLLFVKKTITLRKKSVFILLLSAGLISVLILTVFPLWQYEAIFTYLKPSSSVESLTKWVVSTSSPFILRIFSNLLSFLATGGPIVLVGILGTLYSLLRRSEEDLLLILWALPLFVFHVFFWDSFSDNYWLPIITPIIILSSKLIIDVLDQIKGFKPKFMFNLVKNGSPPYKVTSGKVLATLIVIFLMLSLAYDFNLTGGVLRGNWPRERIYLTHVNEAIDWLAQNANTEDIVLVPNTISEAYFNLSMESLENMHYSGIFKFYSYNQYQIEPLYLQNGSVDTTKLLDEETNYVIVIGNNVAITDIHYEDVTQNPFLINNYYLAKEFSDPKLEAYPTFIFKRISE